MRAQLTLEYALLIAGGVLLVSIATTMVLQSGKTVYEEINSFEAGKYGTGNLEKTDLRVKFVSYPNVAKVNNSYEIRVQVSGGPSEYTLTLDDEGAKIVPPVYNGREEGEFKFTWTPESIGTHKITAKVEPKYAVDTNPDDNVKNVEVDVKGVPKVSCPFHEGCKCLQYFIDYYESYSHFGEVLVVTLGEDVPWDDEVSREVFKSEEEYCAVVDYNYPSRVVIDLAGGSITAKNGLKKAIYVKGGGNVEFRNGALKCSNGEGECIRIEKGSLLLQDINVDDKGEGADVPIVASNGRIIFGGNSTICTHRTSGNPVFLLLENSSLEFSENAFLNFENK